MATQQRSIANSTVHQLIEALQEQDLDAALALYASDAEWEIHVPGWDTDRVGQEEIAERLVPWFMQRDNYEVVGYSLIEQGNTVALRWEQHWTDGEDGAPCTCHQSHFFEVNHGLVRRHWMYCAGVMAHYPES
jgi:ketosteroid isomerase-like protein